MKCDSNFFSAVRCHGEIRVDECGRFFVFVLLDISECSIAVQLVAVTNAIYKYIFAVTNGLLFCFIAKMFVISTTIWAHYTKKGTLLARSFQRANVLLTIESRFCCCSSITISVIITVYHHQGKYPYEKSFKMVNWHQIRRNILAIL